MIACIWGVRRRGVKDGACLFTFLITGRVVPLIETRSTGGTAGLGSKYVWFQTCRIWVPLKEPDRDVETRNSKLTSCYMSGAVQSTLYIWINLVTLQGVITSLYRRGNRGTERLSYLPRVRQSGESLIHKSGPDIEGLDWNDKFKNNWQAIGMEEIDPERSHRVKMTDRWDKTTIHK